MLYIQFSIRSIVYLSNLQLVKVIRSCSPGLAWPGTQECTWSSTSCRSSSLPSRARFICKTSICIHTFILSLYICFYLLGQKYIYLSIYISYKVPTQSHVTSCCDRAVCLWYGVRLRSRWAPTTAVWARNHTPPIPRILPTHPLVWYNSLVHYELCIELIKSRLHI